MVNIDKEHAVEAFRSLIEISVAGLKLLAILNGGAAVALLAYLGNVAGKGAQVPDLRFPIGCYMVGVVLTGFAFICSYLTQLSLFNELVGRAAQDSHKKWLKSALVVVLLGLSAFAVGSSSAVRRFQIPVTPGTSLVSPAQPEKH